MNKFQLLNLIAIICFVVISFGSARLDADPIESGGGGPLSDAFGDAEDVFGVGPPLIDIALFDLGYDQQDLYFTVSFFTPIAPASAQLPESLAGTLEFDVDQNVFTGNQAVQTFFSPPFETLQLGADFLLDFGPEESNPGFAQVTTWEHVFVSWIPVTFDDMTVHGVVPLADLGNDDGRLNFTGLFGTLFQPTDATDRVGTSYAVPEPGTTTILTIIAAMLFRRPNRAGIRQSS